MANYHDITLALAGVCQSARVVQQFSHQGCADPHAFRVLLESLLVTQPDSTLAVYGNQLNPLKVGFETVLSQFGGGNGKLDTEIGHYWMSLLALSSKLAQNPAAKAELSQRLQQIERQLQHIELLDEQLIANLASIYSEVISPLGRRILVKGSQDYLARPDIQNRVRAALLAGVRAGVLWQQVGGSRWQFLFARKRLLRQAHSFYSSL